MSAPRVLPPFKRTENDARTYALAVHKGQADKAGHAYWHHLVRVHDRFVEIAPADMTEADFEIGRQAAWLHDTIEQDDRPFGPVTYSDLSAEGFSVAVCCAVATLTRDPGETYRRYIDRIIDSCDQPATLVKIADLEDNLNPVRLGRLDPDKAASLRERYEPALAKLRTAHVNLAKALGQTSRPTACKAEG